MTIEFTWQNASTTASGDSIDGIHIVRGDQTIVLNASGIQIVSPPYQLQVGDKIWVDYTMYVNGAAKSENKQLIVTSSMTAVHLSVDETYAGSKRSLEFVVQEGGNTSGQDLSALDDYEPAKHYDVAFVLDGTPNGTQTLEFLGFSKTMTANGERYEFFTLSPGTYSYKFNGISYTFKITDSDIIIKLRPAVGINNNSNPLADIGASIKSMFDGMFSNVPALLPIVLAIIGALGVFLIMRK